MPHRTATLALTVAAVTATTVAVAFAGLHWADRSGWMSHDAASLVFAAVCVTALTAATWLFIRRAIPPITEQTNDLLDALERTEEMNRRQAEFLTHVHHELRTPLTKLVGATETLQHRGNALDAHRRELVRDLAYRSAIELHLVVEGLSVSVEYALPGFVSEVSTDNWSSPSRLGDPETTRET